MGSKCFIIQGQTLTAVLRSGTIVQVCRAKCGSEAQTSLNPGRQEHVEFSKKARTHWPCQHFWDHRVQVLGTLPESVAGVWRPQNEIGSRPDWGAGALPLWRNAHDFLRRTAVSNQGSIYQKLVNSLWGLTWSSTALRYWAKAPCKGVAESGRFTSHNAAKGSTCSVGRFIFLRPSLHCLRS